MKKAAWNLWNLALSVLDRSRNVGLDEHSNACVPGSDAGPGPAMLRADAWGEPIPAAKRTAEWAYGFDRDYPVREAAI